MYIVFSDEGGLVLAQLDEYGVSFCDGRAYFSTEDGKEYRVDISAIREIRRN